MAWVPSDLIINRAQELFDAYGYWFVLGGAFVEGLLFITIYFPGSTIIAIAAALSRTGQLSLPGVIILGAIGLQLGLTIDYALGRYGWYHLLVRLGLQGALERSQKRVEKYGLYAMITGYIIPMTGALTATSAGILRVPFHKFFLASSLIITIWVTVVSIAAYLAGEAFVRWGARLFWPIFFAVIGGWFVISRVVRYRNNQTKREPP